MQRGASTDLRSFALPPVPFAADMVGLLREAQEHLAVRVFTKTVQGSQRVIVLLGEEHFYDTPEEAAGPVGIAQRLEEQFGYVAREGSVVRNVYLDVMHSRVKNLPQERLGPIDSASTRDRELGQLVGEIRKSTERVQSFANQNQANAHLVAEMLDQPLPSGINVAFEQGKIAIQVELPPQPVKIHLEKGYQQNFGDRVIWWLRSQGALLQLRVWSHFDYLMAELALMKDSKSLGRPGWRDVPRIGNRAVSALAGYSALRAVGLIGEACASAWRFFSGHFPALEAKRLDHLQYGYRGSRDRHMARVADTFFSTNPACKEMLAQVGKAHVPELSVILQRRHGWALCDLDQ